MAETLRIEYDDNAMDLLDKVNLLLQPLGWQFVDDMLEHDSYLLCTLIEVRHDG